MTQEYSTDIDRLVSDVQRKPLVLFVGAGINEGKLRTWDGLLDYLLRKALVKFPAYCAYPAEIQTRTKNALRDNLTVYEQATLVKHMLGEQYRPVLKEAVYGEFSKIAGHDPKDEKFDSTFVILTSIARLCQNSCVQAVVSYNYDDLLEAALNRCERKAYNVCGATVSRNPGASALPVYHVHGFIRNESRVPSMDESRIVLSLDEYFQNIIEPYSWQTTSQLYFLQNYTCLYIGCSLNDINMQRLLGFAKKYTSYNSVYIMSAYESLAVKSGDCRIDDFVWKSRTTMLSALGVRQIITGKSFSSISGKIDELAEKIK